MSGLGRMLQDEAYDAIKENGEPLKLVRVVPPERDNVTGDPVIDPATGLPSQEVRTEQTIKAIISKASGGVIQAFDNRLEKGTLIETHLRSILIAGKRLKFIPMPGDHVEFDGVSWSVLGSTPDRSEGLDITHTLTVQR